MGPCERNFGAGKARSCKNGPALAAPQGCGVKSVDGQEPRLWIIGRASTARQRLAKIGHAGEIVDRTERIDVRQHGPDPPPFWGENAKKPARGGPQHAPPPLSSD